MLGLMAAGMLTALGAATEGPPTLTDSSKVFADRTIPVEESVAVLVRHLDRWISAAAQRSDANVRDATDPETAYAELIRMIAMRPPPAFVYPRPEVVKAVLSKVDAAPDIRNKAQVREFLQIALALDGVPAPEDIVLPLVYSSNRSLQLLGLDAMWHTSVPRRALPKLLNLTQDSWKVVVIDTDVGTPQSHYIFPLREKAAECLDLLGVACDRVPIEHELPHATRLPAFRVVVQPKNITSKLGEWVSSDGEAVWRDGAAVINQIDMPEVRALRDELLKDPRLPAAKHAALVASPETLPSD